MNQFPKLRNKSEYQTQNLQNDLKNYQDFLESNKISKQILFKLNFLESSNLTNNPKFQQLIQMLKDFNKKISNNQEVNIIVESQLKMVWLQLQEIVSIKDPQIQEKLVDRTFTWINKTESLELKKKLRNQNKEVQQTKYNRDIYIQDFQQNNRTNHAEIDPLPLRLMKYRVKSFNQSNEQQKQKEKENQKQFLKSTRELEIQNKEKEKEKEKVKEKEKEIEQKIQNQLDHSSFDDHTDDELQKSKDNFNNTLKNQQNLIQTQSQLKINEEENIQQISKQEGDAYSDTYSEIQPIEGQRKFLAGSFPINKAYYKQNLSKSVHYSEEIIKNIDNDYNIVLNQQSSLLKRNNELMQKNEDQEMFHHLEEFSINKGRLMQQINNRVERVAFGNEYKKRGFLNQLKECSSMQQIFIDDSVMNDQDEENQKDKCQFLDKSNMKFNLKKITSDKYNQFCQNLSNNKSNLIRSRIISNKGSQSEASKLTEFKSFSVYQLPEFQQNNKLQDSILSRQIYESDQKELNEYEEVEQIKKKLAKSKINVDAKKLCRVLVNKDTIHKQILKIQKFGKISECGTSLLMI